MKKIDRPHHKIDNKGMNVVEKDEVVIGLLRDELARCEESLAAIEKTLADLPMGLLARERSSMGAGSIAITLSSSWTAKR
jgi:hypothetical protein